MPDTNTDGFQPGRQSKSRMIDKYHLLYYFEPTFGLDETKTAGTWPSPDIDYKPMDIREFISSLPWQAIIFCFFGIVLIAISIFASLSNKKLKNSGITVDGTIFSLERDNDHIDSDSYLSNVKGKITVSFLTTDKVWITDKPQTNFLISYTGQYKKGEPIKVTYDPENPSNFIVATKQSEKIGRVVVALGGIVFLIAGILRYFDK